MDTLLKKGRFVVAAIAAVIAIGMIGLCAAGTDVAYAEVSPAISVYESSDLSNPVGSFTLKNLEDIVEVEGNKTYNYSAYNTYPSFQTYPNTKGPTIIGIIEAAGVTLESDTLVKISDKSGYSTTLLSDELMENRYYFPNGNQGTANGNKAPQSAYSGAVKVPAIIDITSADSGDNGVFRFGQVAPNEQNNPEFVKYMLNGGKIIVGGKASKCPAVQKVTDSKGNVLTNNATVYQGTEIHIAEPDNNVQIYYSLDGSNPTDGSKIYYYSRKVPIKYPTLDTLGKVTLKIRTIGYGKYDSDVSTFTFNVVPKALSAPQNFKAANAGCSSIRLTWSATAGAAGYRIEQYNTKTKTYSFKKNVTGNKTTSAVITGLKTGTTYKFRIKAYDTVNGATRYGTATAAKSAAPALSKTSITKLQAGSKKITVKWKKVSGAKGYKIYRATSKSGKYKCIKTTKSTSYTNKSLKKGKKYYYKVRAYRVVDGKTKYSSYSAVKYIKAK
ncbi:MAG: fibronectin type III domain-containing protein [Bacillota bacterium]|nr:fibronectin type III domain-containing protein [Bacillota bacterium]